MPDIERYKDYSPFAWFYDTYFDFHEQSLFILDKLLSHRINVGSRILDLGCGTGHLAQALDSRGFTVVGIDGSEDMLSFARKRMPHGTFIAADARDFIKPSSFAAVVSTFDCMNHIMSLAELGQVFKNVFESLEKGGYFMFDLNMEEAFETQWNKSANIIHDDNVCMISGGYDRVEKTGVTRLTMFLLKGSWIRSDVTLFQRCYSSDEVITALEQSGFQEISSYDARKDLNMQGHLAIGRTVFLAMRSVQSN